MSDIPPASDLDLSFLNEIADGSNAFIVESIEMFLEHTPVMLKDLREAIGIQDWKAVTSTAHKLKPNLGFFGMLISQSLIQEVELQSKEDEPDSADILSKFEQASDMVTSNLPVLKKVKAEKANQI